MELKHPCKGDYLDKLLQPATLALLCEGPAHGFYLLSELERRGLVSDADAAGFYRMLRKFESDGKLDGMWDLRENEKPRKVYAITEKGRLCLKNWQDTLHQYNCLVQKISQAVDRAVAME